MPELLTHGQLPDAASSDPLCCTAVQGTIIWSTLLHCRTGNHHWATSYVSFFSWFPFSNLICCRAILGLFFSFSMHRLAIYCIVSIATSKASSPGSVLRIALDCIGYVVSSDRICILGTGKDMKGIGHRLAKRTACLWKLQETRTLCKWQMNGI